MRKADNTIVFGSQGARAPVGSTRTSATRGGTQIMPSATPSFPEPVTRSANPTPAFFVDSVRPRKLSEDLIDERTYMSRPERGLAFAVVSLALIGVAATGTYFFLGSREPVISTTHTTSAEVPPATTEAPAPAPPPPTPTPAPAADTPTTTPSGLPQVDAVRAPELGTKTQAPKEIPGPQLVPTERPQASTQPPAKATTPSKPPAGMSPRAGMSDEALERAGYYGHITPIAPTAPTTTGNADEPKAPSAASTEEPKQFTPVLPDVKIKE